MQAATGSEELSQALAPLRAEPSATAVLTDLDGTLAPIVERPSDAVVPPRARTALRALASRYALVGVISGRRAVEARRLVGLEEITYAGNHGFELLPPGAEEPRLDSSLDGKEDAARDFADSLDRGELEALGIRLEDKGPIVALHWRGAAGEAEAEARAGQIARQAEHNGLASHRGRKVLEIRPSVPIDKGAAIVRLLRGRHVTAALYAGDDRTDADGFRALRKLRDRGEIAVAVCTAVASEEAPAAVTDEADLIVEGTAGFLAVLEELAR